VIGVRVDEPTDGITRGGPHRTGAEPVLASCPERTLARTVTTAIGVAGRHAATVAEPSPVGATAATALTDFVSSAAVTTVEAVLEIPIQVDTRPRTLLQVRRTRCSAESLGADLLRRADVATASAVLGIAREVGAAIAERGPHGAGTSACLAGLERTARVETTSAVKRVPGWVDTFAVTRDFALPASATPLVTGALPRAGEVAQPAVGGITRRVDTAAEAVRQR
jgi:hypothetical protein